MEKLAQKQVNKQRRQNRIRATIRGTSERPRLVVTISNIHVSAQVIDDTAGKTMAYATTAGKKATGSLTAKAEAVGAEIAANAEKAGVKKVVFDRAGNRYQGRIKALADKARSEGLEF